MYYTDQETARKWVDIVVSLSAIGEAEDIFGKPMVLANYSNAQPTLKTLDAVEEALHEVEEKTAALTGHAGDYMRVLTKAQRAVISIMRKEERPYLELVNDILDLEFTVIPDSEAARHRDELYAGLGELGYTGTLDERIEAWLAETTLTGEAVIDLAKEVVGKQREDTLAKVVQLPDTEGLDRIYSVRNVHYSGRSAYTGNHRGWLHFNIDKNWQRDIFIQVLSHEGYPGHQTFYCLWDVLFNEGKWPLEAAYYQLNGPTNVVFEGGPEVALHFIGWDVGDSREAIGLRVGQVFKDLQRIGMNNVCYYTNQGQMSQQESIEYMMSHKMDRGDAERAYQFITHPMSRTHYPQYYYGRRVVNEAFKLMEGSEEGRQKFFDILYRTPHTTSTFIKAIADATGTDFNPYLYK